MFEVFISSIERKFSFTAMADICFGGGRSILGVPVTQISRPATFYTLLPFFRRRHTM